ncbi:organic hydroperoxide resistance protein [Rhizobium lentis]|uniref:Ohr subfamily peroxiredoxin n=1 Tax=Rhizobium lentis TaxID=1138194 RepID=A0A7W9CVW4_9HYPH|nr:organic hydroperoxide resistance protein [Rhizobium lentis]MBB4575145.1 Ohr subfamily peroxiredoxin [Rhizobium lentis]MBB5551454.1 Ohr subfamily peroxiredoxin [Rhizobium lentis]MBB5562050.1 Ohr subfamily peroxiredoxin [Rhizobium lentis]MBB5568633.1 Ohr subfamily peroxiredoxin [Rhizobium lentis]
MSTVIYTGKTSTAGGRDGASRSSDGRLDVTLSPPGSSGVGTNPEQLFAAGWSARFLGAIGRAAAERQLRVPAADAINAEIDLVSNDGGYLLQARLNAKLPGIEPDLARSLVGRAHQLCPYSEATRGNIAVELNVA